MLYQVAGVNGAEEETRTDSLVETIRAKRTVEVNNVAATSPPTNLSQGAPPPGLSPSGKRLANGRSITRILGGGTGFEVQGRCPGRRCAHRLRDRRGQVGSQPQDDQRHPPHLPDGRRRADIREPARHRPRQNGAGEGEAGLRRGAVVSKEAGVFIGGLAVKFMKAGKDALDPKDNYESEWVGDNLGFEKSISGGGALSSALSAMKTATRFPVWMTTSVPDWASC